MDEPHLDIPDPFEAADVGALVKAYAPELEPQPPSLLVPWVGALLAWLVLGGILLGPTVTSSIPVFVVVLALSVGTALGLQWLELRRRWLVYDHTAAVSPWELHERIALKFRQEIDVYCDRLLGPDTEWQRARAALRKAAAEAQSSRDYWTNRWLEDQMSEIARANRTTAKRLHAKLSAAVAELDKREDALLTFFAECEAKIRVLERSRTDYAETKRLAKLSRHADDLVMDATLAIEAIGEEFVAEALRVGAALGALHRLQMKESAGDIEVEGIERVAERILEAAEEEERKMEELVGAVRA